MKRVLKVASVAVAGFVFIYFAVCIIGIYFTKN